MVYVFDILVIVILLIVVMQRRNMLSLCICKLLNPAIGIETSVYRYHNTCYK